MARKSLDTISTKKAEEAPTAAAEKSTKAVKPATTNETPVVETIAPTGTPPPVEATPEQPNPDSYESIFPEPTVVVNPPPTWAWWLVLMIASLVVAFIGYQTVNSQIDSWLATSPSPTPTASSTPLETATPTPEETSSPTPTATATPAPTSTPATKVTVRILNGTTTTGAAATLRTQLQKAGFSVRTIGNAANRNYAVTTIYYQAGEKTEAEKVQKAITGYSPVLEESAIAAPDSVLVVIGKK